MEDRARYSGAAVAGALGILLAGFADPVHAVEGLDVSGNWSVDVVGIDQGGSGQRVRELDKLLITLDADFAKLASWSGGSASLTFMNTSGATPNQELGDLEGIDNIEVLPGQRHSRLFTAWLQQDFGVVLLQAGLIDLNAEFYADDASALLIAPEFGVGSELAASGPGGPSIFPESSLSALLAIRPDKDAYLRAAVFNADVGDPGDPGGVNTDFKDGVLEVIEAGWTAHGKLALGAWGYSKPQDDLFDQDSAGNPLLRTSAGAYLLAEQPLYDGGDNARRLTGFVRAGLSDGNTGPFRSSWQVGALLEHAMPGRPDSKASLAIAQALLGAKYRAAVAATGATLAHAETHIELTYADQMLPHLALQPDLQYIIDAGGNPGVRDFVAMMRFTATL
ncbi:MAG TPA: carbohydrate porin [Steroidobacteraceae bacterium]|nr:carbohydrate porin [Steroidobacteraceae bacterium]